MALARVGKRDLTTLSASDMGFALGPRLNAAGRLQDMSVGIRCLITEDPKEANQLAARAGWFESNPPGNRTGHGGRRPDDSDPNSAGSR